MPQIIDFASVISYSMKNCVAKSMARCATYVKTAFTRGGCEYVPGNGFDNQEWCKKNGFQCIGDFVPKDYFPRAHNGIPMQFPEGYVQQTGDVCLIKHGKFGHICYATGPNIDDWVSDFFQKYPGQAQGQGPYCYSDYNYKRVQFWRHSSVLNDAPVVDVPLTPANSTLQQDTTTGGSVGTSRSSGSGGTVKNMSEIGGGKKKRTGRGIILGANQVQK